MRVSRAAGATWVPVSEARDTAHTRVIHAGETSLQVYVIHYVIEGLGIWELGAGDAVAHPGALRNRWHLHGDGSARVAFVCTGEAWKTLVSSFPVCANLPAWSLMRSVVRRTNC